MDMALLSVSFTLMSLIDIIVLETTLPQVYKKGFYEGVMLMGSQAGKRVCDAKDIVKGEMIAAGTAALYYEPEKQVCPVCTR